MLLGIIAIFQIIPQILRTYGQVLEPSTTFWRTIATLPVHHEAKHLLQGVNVHRIKKVLLLVTGKPFSCITMRLYGVCNLCYR